MDGGGRRGRNGGSGGGAHRQDDALGCLWEAVPPLCLLFRLALSGEDRTERFDCMQPGRNVGKDARETPTFICPVLIFFSSGFFRSLHEILSVLQSRKKYSGTNCTLTLRMSPNVQETKKIRALIINKDERKSLASKNGNEKSI